VAGTRLWLNPAAFISVVDPTTGACTGGNSVTNCQFGDTGPQYGKKTAQLYAYRCARFGKRHHP
jgi:hypothetical protein